MTALVWFRQDLRVEDNSALAAACYEHDAVIAVYIHAYQQKKRHDVGDRRIYFELQHVKALHKQLELLNIPLVVLDVPLFQDVSKQLLSFCQHENISHLYFNDEYALNERKRDRSVKALLVKNDLVVKSYTDHLLFKPGSILTQNQTYYTVFTPFKRACYKNWHLAEQNIYEKPTKRLIISTQTTGANLDKLIEQLDSDIDQVNWPVGEAIAEKQLLQFLDNKIETYDKNRDLPGIDATSQLSAYLNIGVISIRKCFTYAMEKNHFMLDEGQKGITTWLNELLWREFYHHVMVGFPDVCKHKAFKTETENIPWRHAKSDLESWKQGKTGIPIVDAGMRQLKETGWMHNRVRMICAMFLTKNLLIDWREGERWFMDQLVDGCFPANNGGWQWSASTGTDAAPYFRIFNPQTQSEKFDASGDYIRRFVPELADLDSKMIHNPPENIRLLCNYPSQIVDLKISRQQAIDTFRQIA